MKNLIGEKEKKSECTFLSALALFQRSLLPPSLSLSHTHTHTHTSAFGRKVTTTMGLRKGEGVEKNLYKAEPFYIQEKNLIFNVSNA